MRRFTLGQLMLLVVVVATVTAIAIPLFVGSRRAQRRAACASNLGNLWNMAMHWRMYHGGNFQPEVGQAFWVRLTVDEPRVVDPAMLRPGGIFDCPVSDAPPAAGAAEYRGPSGDPNTYADRDPVGADGFGAHGRAPFNVLLKSRDVFECVETDPLWGVAARTTMH